MKPNNDLEYSHEEICSMFSYDKVSGGLKWKHREPSSLKNRQWNGRFANKTAGTIRKDGYLRVKVGCRYILVHRLIWFIEFGEFPSFLIDHINGNKSDNRLENLREVTKSENATNCNTENSTGHKGVRYDKRYNTYQVRLTKNGKTFHLGQAKTFSEAIEIYNQNVDKIHGNFGKKEVNNVIR